MHPCRGRLSLERKGTEDCDATGPSCATSGLHRLRRGSGSIRHRLGQRADGHRNGLRRQGHGIAGAARRTHRGRACRQPGRRARAGRGGVLPCHRRSCRRGGRGMCGPAAARLLLVRWQQLLAGCQAAGGAGHRRCGRALCGRGDHGAGPSPPAPHADADRRAACRGGGRAAERPGHVGRDRGRRGRRCLGDQDDPLGDDQGDGGADRRMPAGRAPGRVLAGRAWRGRGTRRPGACAACWSPPPWRCRRDPAWRRSPPPCPPAGPPRGTGRAPRADP